MQFSSLFPSHASRLFTTARQLRHSIACAKSTQLRDFPAHHLPRLATIAIATVTALVFYCSNAQLAQAATSDTAYVAPLRIVSTPNPNVFPLLLAMSRNHSLPVSLVPVATGTDIINVFSAGQADALLSMTYTAAQDVVSGKIPQLQLVQVNFWRGFWMLAPKTDNISEFSQLYGKGILASGPTAGGKGSGPDLIFQAALKRVGMPPTDFKICYLGVMQAAPMVINQQLLSSNSACDPSYRIPATAISMVEPAASGMVLDSRMSSGGVSLGKAIDMQTLFTGYTAWPATQLPHGGVSVLSRVLANPSSLAVTKTVLKAYRDAANDIMAARGRPLIMMSIVHTISAGIKTYYGQYGMSIPGPVIISALRSGDLIYRTDLSLPTIQPNLSAFLTEVVGTPPPASFYHPLGQ